MISIQSYFVIIIMKLTDILEKKWYNCKYELMLC